MDNKAHIETILAKGVWRSTTYRLSGVDCPVWRRRFTVFSEAELLEEKYFSSVYTSGGALFIAFTAPIRAYTPEESVAAAVAGIRDPWYVELFLIEQITFDQLLFFLEVMGFGKERHIDEKRCSARRAAGMATLEAVRKLINIE